MSGTQIEHLDSTTFTGGYTARPRLARPGSRTGRLRGRLEQLRAQRRRLTLSALIGLCTSGMTLAALATISVDESEPLPLSTLDRSANTEQPATVTLGAEQPEMVENARMLAVDLSSIQIPLAVGDKAELIGLRPTIEAMTSQVIAKEAVVVAVTDQAVLFMISASEAHEALEISAVGSIKVLGLAVPETSAPNR